MLTRPSRNGLVSCPDCVKAGLRDFGHRGGVCPAKQAKRTTDKLNQPRRFLNPTLSNEEPTSSRIAEVFATIQAETLQDAPSSTRNSNVVHELGPLTEVRDNGYVESSAYVEGAKISGNAEVRDNARDDYELPYTPGGLRAYQNKNREKFKSYFSANKYKVSGVAARKYYQQLVEKHFDAKTATGSYFTDPQLFDSTLKGSPLDKLLFIASRQLGGLTRDDRDKYTNVQSDAFSNGSYYVKVEGVQGEQRAVRKEEAVRMFGNGRKVYVVATKDGVPPDYVVRTASTAHTNHATLVMVDEKDAETGELTGKRVVITAFPGSPTPPQRTHERHKAGDVVTLKDVPPNATVLFKNEL